MKEQKISQKNINGTMYYTYDLPMQGGKRKRVYAKTEEELTEKVKAQLKPDIPENLTFKRLYAYFLALNGSNVRLNQIYRTAKDQFPDAVLSLPNQSINIEVIRKCLDETDNDFVNTAIQDFLVWGYQCGKLIQTPQEEVQTDLSVDMLLQLQKIVCSDLEDLDMFVTEKAFEYRYSAIVCLVAFLGLRMQDVLKVRAEGTYEDLCLISGTTTYEIPFVLYDIVNNLRTIQKDETKLFGTVNRVTIAKTFTDYGKRIGIATLTPTMVRKAFGAYLISKNYNLLTVARLMNDSVSTIAENYESLLSENLKTVVEELYK